MSGWDRARYIPWSKIPQDGDNLEGQKERIFRELQRETQLAELNNSSQAVIDGQGNKIDKASSDTTGAAGATNTSTKMPYSNMELFRQAAFGTCIGSITGCVFGFMDGMRTAGQSTVLQKASNMAKVRYLMQGTTRSGSVFGVFFGGFQVLKYGLRVTADPGEAAEIVVSGAVSLGALMSKPTLRPFLPYGSMLIAMDVAQMVMREMDKQQ